MHIQVLSFTPADRPTALTGDTLHVPGLMHLALAEFPGLVADRWEALPSGDVVGLIVWEDAHALRTFRHSELYARATLCPHTASFQDRDFPANGRRGAELAAVAA